MFMMTGQILRVAPAITQQPREGRDQSKEHSLHKVWWPGKPDHVAEFTGEDHQLEKIWHSLSIDPPILRKTERIENHDLEPGRRANLNANKRIFVSRVPPVVRNAGRDKQHDARLRLGCESRQSNSEFPANESKPLFDCRMVMLSHHRTSRRNVEVRDQKFATALLGAEANDSRFARDGVLKEIASFRHR